MRKTRMVVDYEENKVMFKNNPRVWHDLPTTSGERGLMLIPLTEEAVERYTPKNRNKSRSCSGSNKQKRRAQHGTTIFATQESPIPSESLRCESPPQHDSQSQASTTLPFEDDDRRTWLSSKTPTTPTKDELLTLPPHSNH